MRPSEDPLQDADRQDHAETEGEQVPGAERQDQRDDGVPDVAPAAEREGGAPEEDRAGERPAERLDQQRVGDERRREHQHGAPVGAAPELDVLATLRLTAATAGDVEGEEGGDDNQQRADHDRDGGGADRPPGDLALRQEDRLDDDEEAESPQEQGHSVLGAALLPGAAGGGRTHTRPSVLMTDSTRSLSSPRNFSKSSPVTNASVQPLSSSAFFHESLSCIVVTASTHFSVSASLSPGGATMPRQFANTRSTPSSVRVGASTPSTAFSLVTARMRTSPAAADSAPSPMPVAANFTSPPRIPASSSPPPS